MTTPSREKFAKKLLKQQEALSSSGSGAMKKRRQAPATTRGHRLQQLPSPTEQQLQQRESGWNDRFFYEQPLNSNKPPRADRLADSSPKAAKDKKIRDERQQYGNSEIKRKTNASKQPANGRLLPLGHAPALVTETKLEPSKAERLRVKALKAIDSRENALYQLNALILCTPIQETLFQPSRPADPAPPSSSSSAGFQRMRAKAGMALAPAPTSRASSGIMTNARDATKMAQKLAADLQLAGIQCVEAMVEWMLEAGAKAEKPPPFLWRDRNYFVKMHSDLDFAQRELDARGVHLECFTQQNPLLIRPSQKLGRVLAAQAIITEMVEMATARASVRTPQRPFEPVDHGFERCPDDDGSGGDSGGGDDGAAGTAGADLDREQQSVANRYEPEERRTRRKSSGAQPEASADAMILQADENDESQDEQTRGRSASEQSNHEQEHDGGDGEQEYYASDGDGDTEAKQAPAHTLDVSSAEELVHILDESLSDLVPSSHAQQATVTATAEEASGVLTLESARDSARSTSEYDNSFDAEDDGADDADNGGGGDMDNDDVIENQTSHKIDDEKRTAASELRQSEEPTAQQQHPASPKELGDKSRDASTELDDDEDNQSHEQLESTQPHSSHDSHDNDGRTDAAAPDEPDEDAPKASPSALLQTELARLARSIGCDVANTQRVDVAACLAWDNSSAIAAALKRHDALDAALEGSLASVLTAHQLSPTAPQTAELLRSSAAAAAHLTHCLWRECMSVIDSVYGHVASEIRLALEAANSLVSEIEIDEAAEATEAALADVHAAVWPHVRTAVAFLQLVRSTGLRDAKDSSALASTSSGVSALVKVFYPYLVPLPREKLLAGWRRVSLAVGSVAPSLDDLIALMDPTCKTLLLAATASGGGGGIAGDESEDDAPPIPKLTIVCERGNVLQTSVAVLWRKVFATQPALSRCVLFPFFQSSFGEKVVDGLKVEEGEGKGPLKEWIALVSSEMAAKWANMPLDLAFDSNALVEANGNKLVASRIALAVQPGHEVSWRSSDGESVSRIVNKAAGDDTLLLDRGVATQSFAVADLAVRKPRHAFLEYVKASECFWLNAQTANTPANRQVLRVYGWYLATALAHATTIDLPLHPLFFQLLLDETYCVTLNDVRSLDATLHDSLVDMKKMVPADFAAFLELEGADSALSVDAYILQAIDEKFGASSSIGWQFQELRGGFRCVYSPSDLAAAGIDAADLATVVCGSAAGAAQAADFSVGEVFRVALDPDFVKCAPLQRVFWRIVNAFEPRLKRQFVKFVTGVDTLPLPGTEFLRIEMPFAALTPAEHERILHMLPQSHTCDNTLELPNYWRALCWKTKHDEHDESEALEATLAEVLAKKLRGAVEYSSGYGLDGTSAIAGILTARRRPESAASRCAESYDSLDLPAMDDATESAGQTERARTPALFQSSREEEGRESNRPTSSTPSRRREEEDASASASVAAVMDVEGVDESVANAATVPQTASAASPRKSARQHNHHDVEESYGEGDWEEEEELLE